MILFPFLLSNNQADWKGIAFSSNFRLLHASKIVIH